MQTSTFSLILHASLFVKFILMVLAGASIVSWAIILHKHLSLSAAEQESDRFLKAFESDAEPDDLLKTARSLPASPMAGVFQSSYPRRASHGHRDDLRRTIKRYESLEAERLYAKLTFLATTGATAPFIGLLGTVWGIINAFQGIGAAGSASLAVVAPGIAEALVTTAAGLAAAIPAVIAYNYYLSRARRMIVQLEDFSEALLDRLVEVKR